MEIVFLGTTLHFKGIKSIGENVNLKKNTVNKERSAAHSLLWLCAILTVASVPCYCSKNVIALDLG